MAYSGLVENGVVVFDDEAPLPDGSPVDVELAEGGPPKTLAERFANVIGIVDDLPEDFARNHDHYIHSAPKKADEPQ